MVDRDFKRNISVYSANRFKKHLIDVGTYPYPGDPSRKFVVDEKRLEEWVRAFREAGIKVFIPLRHSKDPRDNVGWVEDIFIEGGSLYAVMQITDPEVAEKIRRGSIIHTSLGIEFNFTDDSGRTHKEIIRHIALTLDPHITRQEPFIELSNDREEVVMPEEKDIFAYYDESEKKGYFPHHHSDGTLDIEMLVDALREIDSSDVSEEIKRVAREHIYKHIIEVFGLFVNEKSELERKMDDLRRDANKGRMEIWKQRLKGLMNEGKITPAVHRELSLVLERDVATESKEDEGSVFGVVLDALSKLPSAVNSKVLTRYGSFSPRMLSGDEKDLIDKLGVSEEAYRKYSMK